MRDNVGRNGGNGGEEILPEVRAGLVLVKPKGWQHNASQSRVRTWVLPLMRLVALAACMLCLTPTRGMGAGISSMDAWIGGSEDAPQEDRRSQGGGTQRQEHVVFVGVPEESGVLPLKALAQEMIARGYRASLALPQGFQSWVEDIPGLSFLSLNVGTATNLNQSATENQQQYQHQGGGTHASTPSPCPSQPPDFEKTACAGEGLGDAWGGGVGAGWGAGLGLWRGLRGSLEGAREFLGHLKAYLGFYYREEAAMFAPLVEALRRDPPALVVADRRALAAFRACSELGLRCVVNSPGLLGDLDRPPSSIPAPYTGFPAEGLTIAQRLHSSLIRLVMSLSRLQAARELGFGGSYVQPWASLADERFSSYDESVVSSTVLALGNSCFGSLEHPRELPSSVHMVGPLWMKNSGSKPSGGGDAGVLSPDSYAQGHSLSSGGFRGEHEANLGRPNEEGGDVVPEEVWAWLEPEVVKQGDEAPVVVVQLGFGGGEAWGVSPDAALSAETLDADGARPMWQAFREETVNRLSAVGCRTLWLDRGSHPRERSGEISGELSTSGESSSKSSEARPRRLAETGSPGGGKTPLDVDGNERRFRDEGWFSMVLDVSEACETGVASSCELLLRVMSHRLVTVLVTDGDLRSLQAALWHGKPSVVLPTSPDQREAAARLVHSGAGLTCSLPCRPANLAAAVVEAHDPDMGMRGAALQSGVALREAGGVFRAGNLLENELRTHQAASARRRFKMERSDDWHEDRSSVEDLSWYPDVPRWFWEDFSPLEINLLDVYAVYGALMIGAGILMKIAWSIVWSFCDITTTPSLSRGAGGTGSTESHLGSPSPGPGNENRSNGVPTAATGGKSGRLGGGKYWSSGSKIGKNGSNNNCNRHYYSGGNPSVGQPQQQGVGAVDTASPGLSTPSTSIISSLAGGKQSKRAGLTNGHS